MKQEQGVDQAAIKKLKKHGFEVGVERPVEFYFYFRHEYQAHSAAAQLTNLQFKTVVEQMDNEHSWLCLATKSIDFTSGRLADLRMWMEDLARRYDGEYDGWGTGIEIGSDC